ncbi:MAG: hypothetical protein LQ348_004647 [Seirophora lacunosa]|nr:MAG: hypothetical protein LQ348_004647 [Seirophora lacunosa]
MASRLDWLRTCKLKQLEAIARATGTNSSGTKPILISNIREAILPNLPKNSTASTKPPKKHNHGYSILSIDMGIRNLAYCHLSLPSTWGLTLPSQEPLTTTTSRKITPKIKHWARIDVSKSSNNGRHSSTSSATLDQKTKKEPFDPSTYASHAHSLLTRTLLPLAPTPTHILIERQRFRSTGGSAVQEWTLRVNMLEAMLYAALHTLRASGAWQGAVLPVEPGKVARFWVGGEEGRGKGKREKTKRRKMAVARELVGHGADVEVEEGEAVREIMGEKGKGAKFDDLADSLLQGLAWVKWEENKRLVLEKGLDVLGEFEGRGGGV